jgi:cob(I)alamin adenosyltransferase
MANKPINTNKKRQKGMVYVFTGDGKGKTSAALGVGVRAALSGMKVAMVCWYKSKDWNVSEYKLPKKLKNFEIFPMGVGFYIQEAPLRQRLRRGTASDKKQVTRFKQAPLAGGGRVVDRASEEEHLKAAQDALRLAREIVEISNKRNVTPLSPPLIKGGMRGGVNVLILDEVNNAVKDGLIDLSDLISLISKRGKTHLILTGRGAHKKIIEIADLVTEMKKVKHPFDRGKKTVKGLDY